MTNTNTNASVSVNASDTSYIVPADQAGYIVPATTENQIKALQCKVYEVSHMTDSPSNKAYELYKQGDKNQLSNAIEHSEKHLDVMIEELRQLQGCWDEATALAAGGVLDSIEIFMNILIDNIETLNLLIQELKVDRYHQQQRKSPLTKKGWTFTK